ncbi:MAG TPA: class I SAM-dependent methyltransferase [Gaiellaceae bacterium]
MDPLDDAARRAQRAYEAAADTYDAPANGFWALTGRSTVDRLELPRGARVLDLPCGTGASTLPAAEAVGPEGTVVAVDLAAGLIELASAKAREAGLTNIRFVQADMRATGLADCAFDAVVCVFGVFFVPDRRSLMRELWRMVKPGGTLAVTCWGPHVLEPGATAFWNAVGKVRAELVRGFNPWDDLVSVDQVVELYASSGIDGAQADLVEAAQALRSPDDWWHVVMGSGFRGTVEALEPRELVEVRRANLDAMRGISEITVSAVYGRARKPLAG